MLIYKEELPMDTIDYVELELPYESEEEAVKNILSIGKQDGMPYMWFNVDTNHKNNKFEIIAVGTGHHCEDKITIDNYIGTLQLGPYVFHYFIAMKGKLQLMDDKLNSILGDMLTMIRFTKMRPERGRLVGA